MPPRVQPTAEQLYDVFKEHVQDFDDQKQGYDEDLDGQIDQDTIAEMVKLRETIEKSFKALKKAYPNAAETYPDIATDKRRIFVGLAQLRKANRVIAPHAEAALVPTDEEKAEKLMEKLLTEFEIYRSEIDDLELELIKISTENPQPNSNNFHHFISIPFRHFSNRS